MAGWKLSLTNAMSDNNKRVEDAAKNSVSLARFFLEETPNLVLDKAALNGGLGPADFYYYENGIYNYLGGKVFDEWIMRFLVKYNITHIWKANRLAEIQRAMAALGMLKELEFDTYDNLVCLKNGILNLDTWEFMPHSKDFAFRTMVDVDYNANATIEQCPEFINFLKDLFLDDDGTADQETINNIIRIGGYLLYPQNRLEQMFLFLGEGSNGKSLLIDTFCMFFSKNNISYLDLNTISTTSSLERERLIGSRINITTEAKSNNADSEVIKKIISSEGIEIHRKFAKAVPYKPITKLVVASNTNPYFNDSTHGLFRRIFPITFPNRFVPQDEYDLKKGKKKRIFVAKDGQKLRKIFQKEKTAILNLFLSGLKSLRANGWRLVKSLNSLTTMEDYKDAADTAALFLKDHYEENEADKDGIMGITTEEILAHYRCWYRENVSEKPLNYSSPAIGRKIRELFRVESKRIYHTNGTRKTVFSLKPKSYVEEIAKTMGVNGAVLTGEPENEAPVYQRKIAGIND
jgi:putative DNA primase/helicase